MAKPLNSTNANAKLLNARVRRADGSLTFINKINANGYGTDAKGAQISVKRLTVAGKTLKELDAIPDRGTFVIEDGICHTLSKKDQKALAAGEYTAPKFADLTLTYVDPETGKPVKGGAQPAKAKKAKGSKAKSDTSGNALKEALDTLKPIGKIDRKAALISLLDESAKAATPDQLRTMAREFKLTVSEIKKGGEAIIAAVGRKKAEAAIKKLRDQWFNDAAIKQMPATLKKLMREGELILNQSQTEAILEVLGCDTAFYAVSIAKQLPRLRLSVGEAVVEQEPQKKKHVEPAFASAKEMKKRIKHLTTTLVLPKKDSTIKQIAPAKEHLAKQIGLPADLIKQGLLLTDNKGNDLMLVGFDAYSIVLAPQSEGQVLYAYSKARSLMRADGLRLAGVSELDAKA